MNNDYSALSKLRPTGNRTPWLVRYISLPFIFIGLMSGYFLNGQSSVSPDGGSTARSIIIGNLFLLAVAGAIFVPFIYLIYKFFVNIQRNRAITTFGLTNGLKSLSEAEAFNELPAAFTHITSGITSNGYSFKTNADNSIDIFEYKYSIKSKSKDTDYYSTIAVFKTKNRLPHVFLDSKKDGLMYAYSSRQKVNLEGDFNNFYTVYSPEMANIELRQIFTPDLMQALIDSDAQYDLEINGNRVALIAPGFIYSKDRLPAFLAFAESLRKDIDKESVDWGVIMDVVGSRTSGSVATQLKRNNRAKYIAIGSVVLTFVIYGIMILFSSR